MGYSPLLFSILFFAAFAVYLFFGIYIIYINPKASLNKMFLAVCSALCLWSFGFSIANSASNLEVCLFWRKVSALGWASIYSILLHFMLLLTGRGNALKRWWVYLPIHFPALINIYVFSISEEMAKQQYNLVMKDFGWMNVAVNNGWDIFFYVYYIGYLFVILGLVWDWKQKAADESTRKQASLIFISFLTALLIGSLTDVILSSIPGNSLPQMAPVFTLIPVAVIYYSIKRYGLMSREPDSKDEIILSDETRSKLFHYLSISYLSGGLLYFLCEYLLHMFDGSEDFESAFLSCGLMLGTGFAIHMIQRIKIEQMKYFLSMVVILISIPLITLRFLPYGSITVWIFPVILIIIFLLFNRHTMLVAVTAMAIVTQILLCLFIPVVAVSVNKYDYIMRIGVFVIALLLGLAVNKIYVAKLKEIAYQVGFQKIVSELSLDFVSVNQENFDEKVNQLLQHIGLFFQVDRAYVFLFNHDNSTMSYTHEWCKEGIPPEIGTIENVPFSVFPWWMGKLKNNELVYIENVNELPDEAGEEKKQLTRQNVKSLISIPIAGNEYTQGFLGIDSVSFIRKWSDNHIKLLKILSNLLADGLLKIKAEKDIEYMAYYDYLTGLPNRSLFIDRLKQTIHMAQRTGKLIGVIFIDLDSFKAVNDTIGHSGGDLLIQQVAHSLMLRLRKMDTVARFSGDEFLVMVSNISKCEDIVKIADNIIKMFEKPFTVNSQEFFVTGSAGVAVYPVDGEEAGTLIKNADIAMYKAKSRGKNQYVLCTDDMKEETQKNMVLSNNLYRAMERNELVVYYQPQINLYTGQISGFEALLRWKHPQMGMVSPGVFIPLAEKNGLINSIGEWVLRTACIQNKKWQDLGVAHVRMSVNLSVIQFNNPRLIEMVSGILEETGLNPSFLELEITENITIKEVNDTADILHKLKKLGVSVSIDDFGTEYSSLSRLKTLPVDRIKIDMQFVKGIESNEKDQAITKVIINLAKSLGLSVLAEGVETDLQKDFLCRNLCDEVQGYYYYKPMPAEDIEAILKASGKEKPE